MLAAIAQPTWAEVQDMTITELEAMNIVKGEIQGDEFLWGVEYYDTRLGRKVKGMWKSTQDKRNNSAGPESRATN